MQRAAADTSRILRALANPDRLLLLCRLSQGEAAVGELEAATGIGQPTLSQQLGVLRRLALVTTRREGKQIVYRIDDLRTLALLETLHRLYCPPAEPADETPA
ncbi:helix-turn-helix transcriptional regulator [Edwardsiella piscicida]|uniref:Transcriptional regulator, ArsR family n=3 Tax=Edwardsiella TaxID=635 RepID=A0A0H3DRM3_EDWTF|nr:Transcriptional regulator, ArsR family [Edwardsiella tarda FL6-60]ARD17342.1 transcriptional regulator [Edwardsiella piscicida]ELM3656874.1 helix-turn-helix transcriptional regulator [Edwardsiella piscicida]ELM3736040.1 helix-turn-helix transcriptional regulator [Edwardsiella piscicida]QBB14349.1 transcriptional regulator [Edwardsiella piscicida]